MVAASSRKKSWILSMSHGRTCSSIALTCGVLSVPDLTSSVKLCSLSPARYPLAMNLAFNFWWADFLSYFLALFWTDLLSTSSLHLCSAASNLWASTNSALTISSYSFCWAFMIASSVSSKTSILAYSSVLEHKTFKSGSASVLKSKSSWSPS